MSPRNPTPFEDEEWKMSVSRRIATDLKQRSVYTPDIKFIDQFENHLVFIDGFLRSDCGKQGNFLHGAKYLGKACTTASDYEMKMTPDYPVTFYRRSSIQSKKVLGELYAVSPEVLRNLDVIFGNTIMWCRERQYITCEEQHIPFKNGVRRVTIEAWYYLGLETAFDNVRLNYADMRLHGQHMAWEWDPEATFVMD